MAEFIGWLAQAFPIQAGFAERIDNEMNRMAVDTDRIISEWSDVKKQSVFTTPFRNTFDADLIKADTILEMCQKAVELGGFNYLFECIHLTDFEMGERLRQSKVNMMSKLVTRDTFFRKAIEIRLEKQVKSVAPVEASEASEGLEAPQETNNFPNTTLLSLPVDLLWLVFQRCNYADAQNLALSCKLANQVFNYRSSQMLLPDLTLKFDFFTKHVKIRYWTGEKPRNRKAKFLEQNFSINRRNAILYNTTILRIEASGDFKPQDLALVKGYTVDRTYKKVVVKAVTNTSMVKQMAELFDLNCVELELNCIQPDPMPFPEVKTISIRECLMPEVGEILFAAKHFLNITCIVHNIDTIRKSLAEWDHGEREIGRWLILKPFTIFQTPFGRRHRSPEAENKGHLFFFSEQDNSHILHGELTEYRFHPEQ